MPVQQPPFNDDRIRGTWEYELTALLNLLEGRIITLLEAVPTQTEVDQLADLIDRYESIIERLETSQLYIQDDQPSPVYSDTYLWIQTNVNEDGDFSFWFCGDE